MVRSQRSQDTRERLLDAGVRALREHGYHATGIKSVLDRVDVPKGSFYHYFDSKERFGAAVIRRYGEALARSLDATVDGAGDDPLGALHRHYDAQIEHYRRDGTQGGCLLCNLAAEVGSGPAACRDALAETLAGAHLRLARLVDAARRRGQIRPDIGAEAMAHALQDAWNGALIRMKAEDSVRPLEQFRALHLDRLLRNT